MKYLQKYSLLFILLFCWSCAKEGFSQQPANIIRLLFVGNSLTYTNNIPALVTELGKHDSVLIQYNMIAYPDYGLDDHLADGKLQAAIQKGNYTYVIIQQGPSALPASQAALMLSVKKIKEYCDRTSDTKLALYMVWPSKARFYDFDNVIYSYANAAVKNQAIVCPAGLAWKKLWAADPAIPLYGPDGFHPDLTGSLLAAMTIYGKLISKRGIVVLQDENASWRKQIPLQVLKLLQLSAIDAIDTELP